MLDLQIKAVVLFYILANGLAKEATYKHWPLKDCRGKDIDLLLVADAFSAPAIHENGFIYQRQMQFFSQLVSVFSFPSEKTGRLRVSLLASTFNLTTNTPLVETRIKFDSYTSVSDLKLAIETDEVRSVLTSFPFKAAVFGLHTLFNESTSEKGRNAEQILIMVVNAEARSQTPDKDLELLKELKSKYLNVRIFFVITANRMPAPHVLTDLTFLGPTKGKVVTLDLLLKSHEIPFHLCRMCYYGWFLVGQKNLNPSLSTCYALFENHLKFHWLDASEHCKRINSTLVGIESKEKLTSLTKVVLERIKKQASLSNGTHYQFSLYIGLARKSGSLNHFNWMNKMPLTHTHWGPSEPRGGGVFNCVKWKFIFMDNERSSSKSATIQVPGNEKTYLDKVENFWASTGCGEVNARFYMCESVFREIRFDLPYKKVKLDKPSQSSLVSASNRAQLVYDHQDNTYAALSMLRPQKLNNSVSLIVAGNSTQLTSFPLTQFSCQDGTHISYSLVCDFIDDCPNRRDETICYYRKCNTRVEATCKSGQCVPKEAWCDLVPDCEDKSDENENDCTCPYGRCTSGLCQPTHWFGDGELDCHVDTIAQEKELSRNPRVADCVFMCNRTKCVYTEMLGDKKIDCAGPEGPIDETIGSLEATVCLNNSDGTLNKYSSWAPKCIYIKDRFDEPLGCRNMRHLLDCEDFACPLGYFKCPKSYCIPTYYIRNGVYDCSNGEDEFITDFSCPDHFKCYGESVNTYLHPDLVCDGKSHCPRGDDEINCFMTCREGFLCLDGVVTVDGYNTDIPLMSLDFIDSGTRYLNLTGVDMSNVFLKLPAHRFPNVINATLSRCRITNLNAGHFDLTNFESVVWLDLSFNLIENITMSNILRNMLKLSHLNLSHNEPLLYIHDDAFNFHSPSSLTVLDLSFTGISELKSSMLMPLVSLERLILRNTFITNINPDSFPCGLSLSDLDLRGLTLKKVYPRMFENVIITSNFYTETFELCCHKLHNNLTMSSMVCHYESDPFSSCGDLMSDMILRVLLWVIGSFAISGNLVVIVYRIFFDRDIFRVAYGHFVTHLSFSDLLMGIYLVIIAVADQKYRGEYMMHEKHWRVSSGCHVAGFLSTLSCETSTFFVFFITLDRFLVIKFPFGEYRISRKVMKLCCLFAWIIGFVIALIPLLPIFDHWALYSSNGMCVALPLKNKLVSGWRFASSVFIFFNFFMFIFIALGQFAIYRTISNTRMDQGSLTNANCRRAQDMVVAKHLSLIAISDFMCWFPIGVMGIISLNGISVGKGAYAWSAVLVLPINSAINPLVYTIPAVSAKGKEYMHRVFGKVDRSA